jgi:hypothetical protein
MRVRYKGRLVIAALVVITLIALLTFSSRPPAIAGAITITFLGYTNAQPGNNWRFALFSVYNQAAYTVRGYEDSVEVEGVPDRKRQATHPGYAPALELKAGQSMLMAIGEPYDLPAAGRWRFAMAFSRYTWRSWWLDKSFSGRLPLKVGPVVLVDSQRVLDPTNHVTVTTAWLTK